MHLETLLAALRTIFPHGEPQDVGPTGTAFPRSITSTPRPLAIEDADGVAVHPQR
jgi:hypothetical protein